MSTNDYWTLNFQSEPHKQTDNDLKQVQINNYMNDANLEQSILQDGVDLQSQAQLKLLLEALNDILFSKMNSLNGSTFSKTVNIKKENNHNWYKRLLQIDKKFNLHKFTAQALDIDEEKHPNAEIIMKILEMLDQLNDQ